MPPPDLVSLVGHGPLRARLALAASSGTLPASLLFHGPPGVGKQRLALWLAQILLCPSGPARTRQPRAGADDGELVGGCGQCQACSFTARLAHPDLHWVFPRPRLKDSEPAADDVRRDYAEAIASRVREGMLYAAPGGTEAIYIATVRALVHDVAVTPAMGDRKVIVVGEADRMVAQEGADAAANAFLKVLEEPPADTTIILTSSVPGGLLPTIRSRVAAIRVAPLPDADMMAWLEDPRVQKRLDDAGLPAGDDDRRRRAHGAPGTLLGATGARAALQAARMLVDAARSTKPARRYEAALSQGSAGARGAFTDVLDAVTEVLHTEVRTAVARNEPADARASCAVIEALERAKTLASGNANPQLVTAKLLWALSPARDAHA